MKDNAKLVAAVGGGYLLGKTGKAKLALGLGIWLASKKLKLDLGELTRLAPQTPAMGELRDQLRGGLADAGKQAANAVLTRQADRMADALNRRTASLREESGAEEDQQDENQQDEDQREQGSAEDHQGEEQRKQGPDRGERDEGRPGEARQGDARAARPRRRPAGQDKSGQRPPRRADQAPANRGEKATAGAGGGAPRSPRQPRPPRPSRRSERDD